MICYCNDAMARNDRPIALCLSFCRLKKRGKTERKRECDAITKELFTGNRENIVYLNGKGIVIIFVEIPIMIAKIVYFIQSVPPVEFTCLLTILFRHDKGKLIEGNMRKDT